MKVKRFIASDMKTAMSQVRQSLGAEAVILSNRIIQDGVEILASNDYSAEPKTATSPVLNRPYRTYADIPEESQEPAMTRQGLLDERVDFSQPEFSLSTKRKSASEFNASANSARNHSAFHTDSNLYSDDQSDFHSDFSADVKSAFSQGTKNNAANNRESEWGKAAIFDQRQYPEEELEVESFTPAESLFTKKSPNKKSPRDQYADFEIEDEPPRKRKQAKQAETENKPVEQSFTKQETAQLKQELQTLRSMMETQMSMLNWDKEKKSSPVKTGLLKRLSELGLTVDISKQVLDKVKNINNAQRASKQAISCLIDAIPLASDDILKRNGIVALVGPTGVGKTTTIAKLAARFVMANRASQMALVTLDNYRIGAQEQLFNYARILGVSVHNAKDSNELHKVLQNLYDKKLVLIDTAGMSHKDMRICEQFNTLKQGADEVRSYLVLAANAQTSALDETINAFKQTDISGCILTKLDESASLGGAISMLIRHKLPLTYSSDGQAVPEDLRVAYGRELVAEALDLMKKHAEPVHETDLASALTSSPGQGGSYAH